MASHRFHRRAGLMMVIVAGLLTAMPASRAAVVEPKDYWTGPIDSPIPSTIRGGRVLRTQGVAELKRHDGVVILDVSNEPRKPEGMPEGAPWIPLAHQALPGAIWIPGAGIGDMPAADAAAFKNRLTTVTAGNLDAPLVVYCHEKCWLSWNASKRAIDFGYRQVYWYPEGVEGWKAAGFPTVTATAGPSPDVATRSSPTAPRPRLAVLDIELSGDLGGPEFVAEHAARLAAESARLRADLQKSQQFELVDLAPARVTVERLTAQQMYLHDCNGCDLDIGRELRADQVLVAWVNRVSGLILTLTYEIHEVSTGQILARKSFDFRGDNDSAWNHAIDYMIRHMQDP